METNEAELGKEGQGWVILEWRLEAGQRTSNADIWKNIPGRGEGQWKAVVQELSGL